jgi:hypothetical protein
MVILNLKIETANCNVCFALQDLNLWNGFEIDIKPEQFSK